MQQGMRKTIEGRQHPDRNAQFEHINRQTKTFQKTGQPVISVDTKKKELLGQFANMGREWQPEGEQPKVLVHDFPADSVGKTIPYGVYDVSRNEALVSVGMDHTRPRSPSPAFAVGGTRWGSEHTRTPRNCTPSQTPAAARLPHPTVEGRAAEIL